MKFNSFLANIAMRSFFFFLISYGMLYFSYKFYSPIIGGGSDFFQYYNMYLNPLNFDVASSPFIYRQFSALITNFIIKSGIFYNAVISYNDPTISQRVFFAVLLSNYMALFFTAHIVGKIVDLEIGKVTFNALAGRNALLFVIWGFCICFNWAS